MSGRLPTRACLGDNPQTDNEKDRGSCYVLPAQGCAIEDRKHHDGRSDEDKSRTMCQRTSQLE